uniref:Protein translocase subunit SecA n=1 Tax=Triparma laevis TaxID=1534972 RepID=A0A0K2RWK4_9STRA|nr:preprotein translocase subunit secA [Triparma laevis]BAS19150.1 preprotein translocase subunit secA [Triparma laevis]
MIKSLLNNNRVINQYSSLINEINNLETNFKLFSDEELAEQTIKLKKKYRNTGNLNEITPEAFACTREAGRRTLGLRHFDVQLLGGLVLNDGKIAEMRTGEGKTLVSTLPAYLNGLTEKGVHVVTVNDYLAKRDQTWMGQIHRSLGLNVGLIQEDMNSKQRQINYNADITYITNSELGFDYLRDNMAFNIKDVVQRPFNFCIVDEVDSILIDEARTPLIISGTTENSIEKYVVAAEVVKYLEVQMHFEIDEKSKNIVLTEKGIIQAETFLNIKDLYNKTDPWIPFIVNALRASTLFFNNVHYIVKNNEIVIVDEFTGRIMPDRRWSDGLHQAVEAKESVPIRGGNQTLASITYQNFFLLYPKLSGMTGTGKTAEAEFEKIYNLPVLAIPTAKPNKRNDLPDYIFRDELSKWKAVAKECNDIVITGQPILIGTTSVEKSEILAQLLVDYNLPHSILNAKPENVKKESEIIAQAGEKGSITIATNMAGRGTDIVLGGNIKFKIQKELYGYLLLLKNKRELIKNNSIISNLIEENNTPLNFYFNDLLNDKEFLELTPIDLLKILNEIDQVKKLDKSHKLVLQKIFKVVFTRLKIIQEKDNKFIKDLGGLYIIGTERHESRRIDDQLRGRCGRQGDPGKSRFFLSLDDSLLRVFGTTSIQDYMTNELLDDVPLESALLTKSLDSAQKTVENRNYDSRKYLFDYDEVLNKQRQVIFYERRNVLESNSVRKKILALGDQVITDIVEESESLDIKILNNILQDLLGTSLNLKEFTKYNPTYTKLELKNYLQQQFWLTYELKEAEIETVEIGLMREIERATMLKYIDIMWKEHLQNMSLIRDAVGWRGYGQRNPLFEYKDEAYGLFLYLIKLIRQLVIYELLNIKPI